MHYFKILTVVTTDQSIKDAVSGKQLVAAQTPFVPTKTHFYTLQLTLVGPCYGKPHLP